MVLFIHTNIIKHFIRVSSLEPVHPVRADVIRHQRVSRYAEFIQDL